MGAEDHWTWEGYLNWASLMRIARSTSRKWCLPKISQPRSKHSTSASLRFEAENARLRGDAV
jgi:hypothetical protein